MKEIVSTLKSTVISNGDHVYEICREFDCLGEEVVILTLFPTMREPLFDLTSFYFLNRAAKMNFSKIHFVFLFSQVSDGKVSSRSLHLDMDNMNYLQNLISKLPEAKILISFGTGYSNSLSVIESKVEFFKIIKELKRENSLYQIDIDGMNEEGAHILFCGIRFGAEHNRWGVRPYIIPHRFTVEGHKTYLANKAAAKERFIQNIRKKDTKIETEEKPKKGRKRNDNKES